MKTIVLLFMLGWGSAGWANEPLTQLGTVGPVVDVSNYVMRLVNSRYPRGTASRLVRQASRFPVESPGISAGVFQSIAVELPQLTTPICIVGADALSLQWINQYRDLLVSTRATCIVTNVADEKDVEAIKAILPVPMFAASVNDLLDPIAVDRYPVLLSQTMAEQ